MKTRSTFPPKLLLPWSRARRKQTVPIVFVEATTPLGEAAVEQSECEAVTRVMEVAVLEGLLSASAK